jgi:hypothetical protein
MAQIKKKLGYFNAIIKGLEEHRSDIPNFDKGVESLNRLLLSEYGKSIYFYRGYKGVEGNFLHYSNLIYNPVSNYYSRCPIIYHSF